jgi:hypothetical protein
MILFTIDDHRRERGRLFDSYEIGALLKYLQLAAFGRHALIVTATSCVVNLLICYLVARTVAGSGIFMPVCAEKSKPEHSGDEARQELHATRCSRSAERDEMPAHLCSMTDAF